MLVVGAVTNGWRIQHTPSLLKQRKADKTILTEVKADSAVRFRPLLNLLKTNGSKYVQVGRNIAVDEASVACRSKFGRHLIMNNPTKPGGNYHFRFYMGCCATSWIALNFRLHCTSELEHRLDGIELSAAGRANADDFKVAKKFASM
jgi:hypothetical protein